MTVKTRAQLVTAYGDAAFDFGEPGDELVRDMVDSVAMGWTQLASPVSPSAVSSVEFTSIPQTYSQLMVTAVNVLHDSGSNTTMTVGFSSNNGGAYTNQSSAFIASFSNTQVRHAVLVADRYTESVAKPMRMSNGSASSGTTQIYFWWGAINSGSTLFGFTEPVNALKFALVAGNFTAGTFYLHGR